MSKWIFHNDRENGIQVDVGPYPTKKKAEEVAKEFASCGLKVDEPIKVQEDYRLTERNLAKEEKKKRKRLAKEEKKRKRGKWSQETKVTLNIYFFLFLPVCGLLIGILILIHTSEVGNEQYLEIKEMQLEEPSFKPHVDEAISDGKITQREFHLLKHKFGHVVRDTLDE